MGTRIGWSCLKVICFCVKLACGRVMIVNPDYQLDGIYKYNRSKSLGSSLRDFSRLD